jgi:5'-nucleotidase (lipoprotein e(P4) family)
MDEIFETLPPQELLQIQFIFITNCLLTTFMKKICLSLALLATGCVSSKNVQVQNSSNTFTANGKLYASFFQQSAAEYQALCWQAFNTARMRLDLILQEPHTKPLAIVTDIDETLIDNSPYAVQQSLKGLDYEQPSWEQWTAKASGDTLAGAKTFLDYASSKGVKIFYLTNRKESERAGTLANIQKYHFPDAVNEHLILKTTESSKEGRRQKISETYEIALLLGDNLADFSSVFDKKSIESRNANVSEQASEFGKRFIILPNTSYGDWESAAYQYQFNTTPSEKESLVKGALKKAN